MLTINAMTTADSVLVPIQCEYYALEGLSQLIHTIDLVQQRLNPELQIDGIVFTMYDVRTNLSNQVVENVRTNLDTKIYDTLIPRNIRLAEEMCIRDSHFSKLTILIRIFPALSSRFSFVLDAVCKNFLLKSSK